MPEARPAPASRYTRIWGIGCGMLGVQLVLALYTAFLPLLYREYLDSLALIGLPLAADPGGRDRIGFHVGLFFIFTMTGQTIGPFVRGSTLDILGNHGILAGAAVVFGGVFLLLRAGRRALPDAPGGWHQRRHQRRRQPRTQLGTPDRRTGRST